jgi:hypothetical protein
MWCSTVQCAVHTAVQLLRSCSTWDLQLEDGQAGEQPPAQDETSVTPPAASIQANQCQGLVPAPAACVYSIPDGRMPRTCTLVVLEQTPGTVWMLPFSITRRNCVTCVAADVKHWCAAALVGICFCCCRCRVWFAGAALLCCCCCTLHDHQLLLWRGEGGGVSLQVRMCFSRPTHRA